MDNLHYIQMQMLQKLLFVTSLPFSSLKPFVEIENSQLTFHINQLIKLNLIEKDGQNHYRLTLKGKTFANQIETESSQLQRQGKISVLLVCFKENQKQVLFYTRKKQPYYNHQGFPAGKIRLGEPLLDAAKRELYEETKLTGDPELFRIEHNIVYNKQDACLLLDAYFYMFRVTNTQGTLEPNDEGTFEWIQINDVKSFLQKPFGKKEDLLKLLSEAQKFNGNLIFEEIIEETNDF